MILSIRICRVTVTTRIVIVDAAFSSHIISNLRDLHHRHRTSPHRFSRPFYKSRNIHTRHSARNAGHSSFDEAQEVKCARRRHSRLYAAALHPVMRACVRACVEEVPANAIVPFFMVPGYIPDARERFSKADTGFLFSVSQTIVRVNERIDIARLKYSHLNWNDCVQGDPISIAKRDFETADKASECRRGGRRHSCDVRRERVANDALESRWILNAASIIPKSTNYRGVFLSPRIPVTCRRSRAVDWTKTFTEEWMFQYFKPDV